MIRIMLMALLLTGCAETITPADKTKVIFSSYGSGIDRYDDTENGVSCYVYRGHGMSCLKIKQ